MDTLHRHIEALIFCAPTPLGIQQMQDCLSEMFGATVPIEDISRAVAALVARYQEETYALEIVKAANGFQFMTKPAYQSSVAILLKQSAKKKLSRSALETLAIVAYKQPVSKPQVEQIRGVNCDYAIRKLLDRELIEIKGKAETIGKPVLYGTTQSFLEHFQIDDLVQLPTPKDFRDEEHQIGEEADRDTDA